MPISILANARSRTGRCIRLHVPKRPRTHAALCIKLPPKAKTRPNSRPIKPRKGLHDVLDVFGIPSSIAERYLRYLRSSMINAATNLETLTSRHAFSLIIDAYCHMCIEDVYTCNGDAIGLYAGKDPLPGFRRFLDQLRASLVSTFSSP